MALDLLPADVVELARSLAGARGVVDWLSDLVRAAAGSQAGRRTQADYQRAYRERQRAKRAQEASNG